MISYEKFFHYKKHKSNKGRYNEKQNRNKLYAYRKKTRPTKDLKTTTIKSLKKEAKKRSKHDANE